MIGFSFVSFKYAEKLESQIIKLEKLRLKLIDKQEKKK